jgi:hypothetical protein
MKVASSRPVGTGGRSTLRETCTPDKQAAEVGDVGPWRKRTQGRRVQLV